MYRVLLLCKNNSVLSPMAEAYFRNFAGDSSEVYCAGVEKRKVDPLVISLLKEDGIELNLGNPHQLEEYSHIDFDYILSFDQESEEALHHLPSRPVKYHFDIHRLIPDDLSNENKEVVYRNVRDEIKKTIRSFVRNHFKRTKAI